MSDLIDRVLATGGPHATDAEMRENALAAPALARALREARAENERMRVALERMVDDVQRGYTPGTREDLAALDGGSNG